jgi:hypothetical protein
MFALNEKKGVNMDEYMKIIKVLSEKLNNKNGFKGKDEEKVRRLAMENLRVFKFLLLEAVVNLD